MAGRTKRLGSLRRPPEVLRGAGVARPTPSRAPVAPPTEASSPAGGDPSRRSEAVAGAGERGQGALTHVTALLRLPGAFALVRREFPWARDFVASLNRDVPEAPLIPPSIWTRRQPGGGALVGTAFDYLVGLTWGQRPPSDVLRRAESAAQAWDLVPAWECLRRIVAPFDWRPPFDPHTAAADYLRALVLLAAFDAGSRRLQEAPAWLRSATIRDGRGLTGLLRARFPAEVVDELRALIAAARADLPRGEPGRVHYNPNFGRADSDAVVLADGDLLVGDTLVDLKVLQSGRWGRAPVLQLLAYVALDRLAGRTRIQRIGLYNPRFRRYWNAPVPLVVGALRGGDPDGLGPWFWGLVQQLHAEPPSGDPGPRDSVEAAASRVTSRPPRGARWRERPSEASVPADDSAARGSRPSRAGGPIPTSDRRGDAARDVARAGRSGDAHAGGERMGKRKSGVGRDSEPAGDAGRSRGAGASARPGWKQIRLRSATIERLSALGAYRDSLDDIVQRLLDAHGS